MKTELLAILLSCLFTLTGLAQMPIQVLPQDSDAVTVLGARLIRGMIDENKGLQITNKTDNLRLVLSLSSDTRSGSSVIISTLEIRPANSDWGILLRNGSVAVPNATITEAILLRAGSVAYLYNGLLVRDNMMTKMSYVQQHAKAGSLNDIADALTAVRRIYGNNPTDN